MQKIYEREQNLDSQFFKQVPLDKDSSSHTLNSADMLEVLGSQNLMISMEYGSSQSSSNNMKSEGNKALRYDLCRFAIAPAP